MLLFVFPLLSKLYPLLFLKTLYDFHPYMRNPDEQERLIDMPNQLKKVLREIISSEILNNPIDYNEAILERPIEDYCDWILRGDSWGGGIEISIFVFSLSNDFCMVKNASLIDSSVDIEFIFSGKNFVTYSLTKCPNIPCPSHTPMKNCSGCSKNSFFIKNLS